jgi:hypothetical protein
MDDALAQINRKSKIRNLEWLVLTATLIFAILAAPLAAIAQPPTKIPRIGYLSSNSPETFRVDVFRQALHELGWVEGRDLIIDYRSAVLLSRYTIPIQKNGSI